MKIVYLVSYINKGLLVAADVYVIAVVLRRTCLMRRSSLFSFFFVPDHYSLSTFFFKDGECNFTGTNHMICEFRLILL